MKSDVKPSILSPARASSTAVLSPGSVPTAADSPVTSPPSHPTKDAGEDTSPPALTPALPAGWVTTVGTGEGAIVAPGGKLSPGF